MKKIKRWIANLRWLFNHPPTTIVSTDEDGVCEFCGATQNGWVKYRGVDSKMYICYDCLIKAFRKVLKKKNA